MTDYYLDASAASDGTGTPASPFKVLNGKTFANFDRVWIRRTGSGYSVTNAVYAVPNVKGLELIAWPRVGEYGYYDRDASLTAWDADVADYWYMWHTSGTLLTIANQYGHLIRGAYIEQRSSTATHLCVSITVPVTISKCYLTTTVRSAITEAITYTTGTALYVSNTTVMLVTSVSPRTVNFNSGSVARHNKFLNVTMVCNTTATTWTPTLIYGHPLNVTKSTIVASFTKHAATTYQPSDTDLALLHMSFANTDTTSTCDIKLTADATLDVVSLQYSTSSTTSIKLNSAILKAKSVILASMNSSLRLSNLSLWFTTDTIKYMNWYASNVYLLPYTTDGTIDVITPRTLAGITDRLFFKKAAMSTNLISTCNFADQAGIWMSGMNGSKAILCNVRRQGGGSTTVQVTQTTIVQPSYVGLVLVPDSVYVGLFANQFNSLYQALLTAGTHTVTFYMADYTGLSLPPEYRFRSLVLRYCIDGIEYFKTSSIIQDDTSTWLYDSDLTSCKIAVTVDLPVDCVVSARIMFADTYIVDAYTYLDLTPIIT